MDAEDYMNISGVYEHFEQVWEKSKIGSRLWLFIGGAVSQILDFGLKFLFQALSFLLKYFVINVRRCLNVLSYKEKYWD